MSTKPDMRAANPDPKTPLLDICRAIVRDAIPATKSGATCFVPRYQIKALRDAVEDAAQSLAARDGWEPIATAPKDGSPILACYAPRYDTHGFLPVAVRWRTYHPNAKGNEEWRDSSGAKVRAITHWRPLPEPPTQPQQEASDG